MGQNPKIHFSDCSEKGSAHIVSDKTDRKHYIFNVCYVIWWNQQVDTMHTIICKIFSHVASSPIICQQPDREIFSYLITFVVAQRSLAELHFSLYVSR
jgi:hypothetical protein